MEYDIQKVADTIGLDKDTMLMLMDEFFSVMDEEIVLLEKAVSASDADQIKHVAHKMKGAAANMMVEELRQYCSELQDSDKSDQAKSEDLLNKIKSTYEIFKSIPKG
jgi:HPt (histidine-containing phosphotransfer) domain-containing protein